MGNIHDNLFHPGETSKEKKQRILRENQRQGKAGEQYADDQIIIQGYEIEETGKGSDRHIIKRDIFGNIVDEKNIDYKTGKANLSDLQEEEGAEEYRVWIPPFFREDL